MALFGNKSDEARAATENARDTAPREEGQAALTPEAVHDRADAAETAATRPLGNESVESTEPLGKQDHFQGADAAASSDADSARRKSIAERAYYKAQQRGFAPGNEDADWLDAEKEEKSSAGRGDR